MGLKKKKKTVPALSEETWNQAQAISYSERARLHSFLSRRHSFLSCTFRYISSAAQAVWWPSCVVSLAQSVKGRGRLLRLGRAHRRAKPPFHFLEGCFLSYDEGRSTGRKLLVLKMWAYTIILTRHKSKAIKSKGWHVHTWYDVPGTYYT